MGNAFCPEVSNTTNDLRVVRKQESARGQLSRRTTGSSPTTPITVSNKPGAAKKSDFNFIKVIGAGSYGKVYLV